MNNSSELQTRHLAVEIFSAVLRKDKGLEDEFSSRMERQDAVSPLEMRDRMFVRLLATTMLRRLGQIDDIISRFLKKPLPEKAVYIQDVLRLSTAQLVFLDTPPHAAVSTGVSLVKNSSQFHGFSGLANAVLRRIAQEGKRIAAAQAEASLNIPAWLYDKWCKEYGKAAAEKIAAAALKEAPLDFTVKKDPAFWAEKLEAIEMPTGSLRREKSASIPSLPGFSDGEWWIQDLSAALPASLFQDLKGKTAVDICAAPGGKTAQLITAGAKVTAVDVSASRIKRLKENLDRLKLSAETVAEDARRWWEKEKSKRKLFDAVLLDAPCSATGTLRRHPDVIWHRTQEDVRRLNKAQKELLDTAIDMTAQNGRLVYCVCSVLAEEGRQMIDKAVAEGRVERIPVTAREVPEEMISADGDLLVLPYFYEQDGGCDGFFASRLKRKG